jgi:hypothetical protein
MKLQAQLLTHARLTGDGDSNSSNLGIKGIIAIKAMAQISDALNQSQDANYYSVHNLNVLYKSCLTYLTVF